MRNGGIVLLAVQTLYVLIKICVVIFDTNHSVTLDSCTWFDHQNDIYLKCPVVVNNSIESVIQMSLLWKASCRTDGQTDNFANALKNVPC